jgi:hypothetical protein
MKQLLLRTNSEQKTVELLNQSTVTCLVKAAIAEPEKTSVSRQWLCKHVSTATKSCDRHDRYTRNNRGAFEGVVLCWVTAEAMYGEPIGALKQSAVLSLD